MMCVVEHNFREGEQPGAKCLFDRLIEPLLCNLFVLIDSLFHQILGIVFFYRAALPLRINQDNSRAGNQ